MIHPLISILAALSLMMSGTDSSDLPTCPYKESKRPINVSSFKYLCPGGDEKLDPYFLFGYLGSFNPEYNGVSTLIAGAIPLAVEQVNK